MKFKIATILELVVPLSVVLLFSSLLGCGGGATSTYGASQRYDSSSWTVKFWGATALPAGASAPGPGNTVICNDDSDPWTALTIANGFGRATQHSTCYGVPTDTDPTGGSGNPYNAQWDITIDIDASGVVKASVNGGQFGTGTCQNLYTCSAIIGKAPIGMLRPF